MSTTRKFDLNWPHGHINGRGEKARILVSDLKMTFAGGSTPVPIIAAHTKEDGKEYTINHAADGSAPYISEIYCLHNAPIPKKKIKVAIYLYSYTDTIHSNQRQTAAAMEGSVWFPMSWWDTQTIYRVVERKEVEVEFKYEE